MTETLSGKRIWLIGAGSGIGKSLALALAAANNRVVISGRDVEKLAAVVAEAGTSAAGQGQLMVVGCDSTVDEKTASAAAEVQTLLGGLDVVIYCAGRCEYVDDAELDTDLFRRVYDVNVFGLVNVLKSALPLLKQSDSRPLIAGVASLSAVVGLPRAEAYGSSKAGMIYLLNSLRLGLTKHNIDVSVVNPGFVVTPMTAQNDFSMPFLMQADEAAQCIIRGLEKRKRTVNFPFRLWFVLKFAASFPTLWYKYLGPKMAQAKQS